MKRSVGMLCSDRVEPLLSAALAGRSDDQIFIPSLRVKSGKREKKKNSALLSFVGPVLCMSYLKIVCQSR